MICGIQLGWPDWTFVGLVMLIAFPASWWNISAFALGCSWLIGQTIWLTTCDNLPYMAYALCDYAVIVTIVSLKRVSKENELRYDSVWQTVYCILWGERSDFDRAILAVFPIAWFFYFEPFGPYTTWACLWLLTAGQILFAASESYHIWRRERAKRARELPEPESPSSGLSFALARGIGEHG